MVADLVIDLVGNLVLPLAEKRFPLLRKVALLLCGVLLSAVACCLLLTFFAA